MLTFTTALELHGKTATGIRVPAEIVERLGKGQRPPVVVTIGSYSYRSTVAAYVGEYFLPLAAEHRQRIGVEAGDQIIVGVELDREPRVVELSEDLSGALAAERLLEAFRSLSYSHQRRHAESVEDAKTEATRKRRIEKVVAALRQRQT